MPGFCCWSRRFLATTAEEWETKLRRLLTDASLRARFAEAGRRTVEERYSLRVNAPKVAAVLGEVLARRQQPSRIVGKR